MSWGWYRRGDKMLTYEKCAAMFTGRNKNKGTRKLCNNTYVRQGVFDQYGKAGVYFVRYHATDIIELWQDRTLVRHSGWTTVTTKDRFNRFTNASIASHRGYWWIYTDAGFYVPFNDVMTLNGDGRAVLEPEEYHLWMMARAAVTAKRPQGYATYMLGEEKTLELYKKFERADATLAA